MASPTSDAKVLISGAGPAGLVLAISLARNGVRPRIIDRRAGVRIAQRGAAISPRTLELLGTFGVLDEFMRQSIPFPLIRMYKMPEGTETLRDFEMVSSDSPSSDRPYPNWRLLGQNHLEAILLKELERLGVLVEYDRELQSLEERDDKVYATYKVGTEEREETAVYDIVVGADGPQSVVRNQLGLALQGHSREENFVVGDVKVEGLSRERWHMWGDMKEMFAFLRPTETEGLFALFIGGSKLTGHKEIISSDETLKAFVKKHTGNRDDFKVTDIVVCSHYRTNVKMAENFAKGRVFITGDAAHIHSPTGAQGLNTGVQDSYNLGWKLALVLNGRAPFSLLDSYAVERLPIVAEMLDITTHSLKTIVAKKDEGWDRKGKWHQLGVNYRFSPIVIQEEDAEGNAEDRVKSRPPSSVYTVDHESNLQAGDRAPDASGLVKQGGHTSSRLFEIFDPCRHIVLVFSDRAPTVFDNLTPEVKKYAGDLVRFIVVHSDGEGLPRSRPSDSIAFDVYKDAKREAYRAYKGPDGACAVFVIRPDGCVGARLGSLAKIGTYFEGIFGGVTSTT